MTSTIEEKTSILYVFGGEKAQGAEIVIERLMAYNAQVYDTHLILAPGEFADSLLGTDKPYRVETLNALKKLNRTFVSKVNYYLKAVGNHFVVSRKIYQYVKANNIDIVHSNTLVASAYLIPAIIYSRVINRRVKWLWSDHDLQFFSNLEHKLADLCNRFYDRTLLVSNALKKKYGNNDKKLRVLYNGLDPQHFRNDPVLRAKFREEWSLAKSDIVICIAGSINPNKGQLELIEVFNKISVGRPNIKLLLAGSYAQHFPDFADKIRALIKRSVNIVFVGFISETDVLFNGCDIIVNNSNSYRSESLGTTIYEAMACEKILIASHTGGTPEIITDNVEGFLFEADDKLDLERKLINVIDRFEGLDHVRLAARQKVLQRFDIKIMAANYQEMLNDVLKRQ